MPTIFALSDLHLSFGTTNKKMDIFGENWTDHATKMAENWDRLVTKDDFVLIAGDISWAKKLQEALVDLEWIDSRPGTKILIRGNHDYWWDSLTSLRKNAPPTIHFIQNDVFENQYFSVAGAKLYDSDEYSFNSIYQNVFFKKKTEEEEALRKKLFAKEILRLKMSLEKLPKTSPYKVMMVHYPPIGLNLHKSIASELAEEFNIDTVIFGHLHGIKENLPPLFGEKSGINYVLTSADYLQFSPIKIKSLLQN